MCIINKCCYCIRLRIGVIFADVLTAIWCLWDLILILVLWMLFGIIDQNKKNLTDDQIETAKLFVTIVIVFICIEFICLLAALVLLSLCLAKDKLNGAKGWLICIVIIWILTAVCFILLIISTFGWYFVICNFWLMIWMIYFWVVVFSFYKKGGGDP